MSLDLLKRKLVFQLFCGLGGMVIGFKVSIFKGRAEPVNRQKPSPGKIYEGAGQKESSAVLKIESIDLATQRREYLISGDGHTHEVKLSVSSWSRLASQGFVVCGSEPSSTPDGHCHWVYVSS